MINNKYVRIVLICAVIIAALLLIPYVFSLFLPFILAFIIASVSQRMVRFLERRLKVNRGVSSALVVLFIVSLAGGLITYIIYRLGLEFTSVVQSLPHTIENFKIKIDELAVQYSDFTQNLSPEISEFLNSMLTELQESSKGLMTSVTEGTLNTAKTVATSFPSIVVFLIMFLMGTFFFIKDYDLVINFLKELLPDKWVEKITELKERVFTTFFKYLKAQLIIMAITCAEVTVALWIIGVKNAIFAGLITGLVDSLPIFGTSIILIPWAVISLVYGDIPRAVAFVVIQCMCFVVRQLIEPRIVSKQIGVHPLLTLMSVFVGLKLIGVLGVIVGPISVTLAANFYVSYKESK